MSLILGRSKYWIPASAALLLVVGLSACDSSSATPGSGTSSSSSSSTSAVGPTDTEAKASITTKFKETYASTNQCAVGPVTVDDVSFGQITHGTQTDVADFSGLHHKAWPIKVAVHIHYTNGKGCVQTAVRGEASTDVFLFYKDSFGTWTFQTGSL